MGKCLHIGHSVKYFIRATTNYSDAIYLLSLAISGTVRCFNFIWYNV